MTSRYIHICDKNAVYRIHSPYIHIELTHTVYVYQYTHGISSAKYGNESGVANPIHKSTREYKCTMTSPKLEGEVEKYSRQKMRIS